MAKIKKKKKKETTCAKCWLKMNPHILSVGM